MLIAFDWDGVFVKNDVANEAAQRRLKQFGVDVTKEYIRQAQKNLSHYEQTKDAISRYTGITDPALLTRLMVNAFIPHYLAVLRERQKDFVYHDLFRVLREAKQQHSMTCILVTGLAERTILPTLDFLGVRDLFEGIYANTEELTLSKEDRLRQAATELKEEIALMIGDRKEDLLAGKAVGAKTAFVTWGVDKRESCEDLADYLLETATDLPIIIDSLT